MVQSSGVLIYKIQGEQLYVLLGKCGGPIFQRRTKNCWSIPKGHVELNEELFDAAVRQFSEETSLAIDSRESSSFKYLGEASTASGKRVHIFAKRWSYPSDEEGFVQIKSNLCQLQWPPHSGQTISIPEISQAKYFKVQDAYKYIFTYQRVFLDKLKRALGLQ